MPRVKIDTPGVTIELDATEASVAELGKQAMDMYREATEINGKDTPGAGAGLFNERRDSSLMGFGSTYRQVRPISEVR